MNNLTPELGRAALRAFLRERSPLGALKVMAQRVGRFFQIPLPMFHPYIVFGAEANRKVLVTEREKFLWRNHDPVADLLRRGVLVVDGEEHDKYRALMEPPLHPSQLPGYAQMMIQQTDRVASTWKAGEAVDMLVESRKIALLIIMQTLFSKDVWDDLPRIWTPTLKAIEFISPGAWILWRRMPRPGFKKPLRLLDDYLLQIISERRAGTQVHTYTGTHGDVASANLTSNSQLLSHDASPVSRPPSDLLQHLIAANLPDNIIRDQMLTMMIAGHDTSTALLAWTFALLGQHPETYASIQRELDEGEKSPLLDMTIKESLRLYPPIHIGNRIMGEDCPFEGGTIPQGERMFYSIYLTHRDPSIWENADSFCPERFAHGRKTPPFSYVPFGGGPRACIGAAFGQFEARVVMSRLLRTFTFEFTGHTIHAHMGATLEPRPGVMMRVTKNHGG
ncbi:MAG: cytochrome P450 [Chloroflexota bacterium]